MKTITLLLISIFSGHLYSEDCLHKTVKCSSEIQTQNTYILSYQKCLSNKSIPTDKYGSFKVIANNYHGEEIILHDRLINTTDLHYFDAEILDEEIVKLKITDTGLKSKNAIDLSTTDYDFVELPHYKCQVDNEFNPKNCQSGSWFDGCNYCIKTKSSDIGTICSKRMCPRELMEKPKCLN